MKKDILQDAMCSLDDDLLENAKLKKKSHTHTCLYAALGASAAVAAAVAILLNVGNNKDNVDRTVAYLESTSAIDSTSATGQTTEAELKESGSTADTSANPPTGSEIDTMPIKTEPIVTEPGETEPAITPIIDINGREWPTKVVSTPGNSSDEVAQIKPWYLLTRPQQYGTTNVNGNEYTTRVKELSADYLGEMICPTTMKGYDYIENADKTMNAKAYSIRGIDRKFAIAVIFEGEETAYVYTQSIYENVTIQYLFDAFNLTQNMATGPAYYVDSDKNTIAFEGLESSRVFELLLSNAKVVSENDIETYDTLLSISVSLPLLGIEDHTLTLTADGYIWTNLFDYGKYFRVDQAQLNEFTNFVISNCQGYIYIYEDDMSTDGAMVAE